MEIRLSREMEVKTKHVIQKLYVRYSTAVVATARILINCLHRWACLLDVECIACNAINILALKKMQVIMLDSDRRVCIIATSSMVYFRNTAIIPRLRSSE